MIYIIFAAPRQGKTYFATKIIVQALKAQKAAMRKGKSYLKVFSNYPVICEYGASLKWEPEYVREEITDSIIVIDEAYQFFNSRNFKNFTNDEHTFFALNGHNNIDIYLIAHSPSRLDTVIREMVNVFYFVKKVTLPFSDTPLWFRLEGYLDELTLSQRFTNKNAVFSVEHYLFTKKVARAYDTHYFRKENSEEKVFPSWADGEAYKEVIKAVENESRLFEAKNRIKNLKPYYEKIKLKSSPYMEKIKNKTSILSLYCCNRFPVCKRYKDKWDSINIQTKKNAFLILILSLIFSRIF